MKDFKIISETRNTDIPIQPGHKLTTELTDETECLRKHVDATKYRKVIGSLIYLMTCTRPDISYSVSILSRFLQEPRELHWRFLKWLLKYVSTTREFSLTFHKDKETTVNLIGYTDSGYATSLEDRKSNSAFVFK